VTSRREKRGARQFRVRPSGLRVGDRVAVVDGPLEGLKGVVVQKSSTRIVIAITQSERKVLVELEIDWVKREAIPPGSATTATSDG
jgi:transcription antitermination factor NusG